jgi:hypothetical protein
MSCCTNSTVRTATFSSGLTQQKAIAAAQQDQARLLATLQRRGAAACCKDSPSQGSAASSSILEQRHATRCLPTVQEQALFPRVGVTESVRIQRRVDCLLAANTNPYNPETRFQQYRPYVPPAPCPAPPPQLQNSTNPKPYFFPGCTPPPIGQRGY